MTFKERLTQEYPDRVGDRFIGGCKGCPYDYGYVEIICGFKVGEKTCEECWNREIPEKEEAEDMGEYKVGDKIIFEITSTDKDLCICEKVIGNQTLRTAFLKNQLDGYDRLDSDYVNEHFGELQDEAYNKGLEDAWKLVRKANDYYSALTLDEFSKHFGTSDFNDFICGSTPQEALARVKDYEEAKSIKMGDVVKCIREDMYSCGVYLNEDETGYRIIFADYDVPQNVSKAKHKLKKTGKHIDIQQILKKISE